MESSALCWFIQDQQQLSEQHIQTLPGCCASSPQQAPTAQRNVRVHCPDLRAVKYAPCLLWFKVQLEPEFYTFCPSLTLGWSPSCYQVVALAPGRLGAGLFKWAMAESWGGANCVNGFSPVSCLWNKWGCVLNAEWCWSLLGYLKYLKWHKQPVIRRLHSSERCRATADSAGDKCRSH